MTVMAGTQKITMGRDKDTDYESKLAAAFAQSKYNPYVRGVEAAMNGGVGEAVRADSERTAYGNSNIPVGELIQGEGKFSYKDTPGNSPLADVTNQTGSVSTQTSSTNSPQENPDEVKSDHLAQRLYNMRRGGQGFSGLNNRNQSA